MQPQRASRHGRPLAARQSSSSQQHATLRRQAARRQPAGRSGRPFRALATAARCRERPRGRDDEQSGRGVARATRQSSSTLSRCHGWRPARQLRGRRFPPLSHAQTPSDGRRVLRKAMSACASEPAGPAVLVLRPSPSSNNGATLRGWQRGALGTDSNGPIKLRSDLGPIWRGTVLHVASLVRIVQSAKVLPRVLLFYKMS